MSRDRTDRWGRAFDACTALIIRARTARAEQRHSRANALWTRISRLTAIMRDCRQPTLAE